MDYLSLLLVLSFVWTCIHFLTNSLAGRKGRLSLPPGPRPLPIIGNILEIGKKPHEDFTNLSKTYGPIMTLKLGRLTTIVLSSPEIAKEAFHTNDLALSSRPILDSARALDHHKISLAWMTVSAPWRNLRKVCAIRMFSRKQLDATQAMRRKKVKELLEYVQEHGNTGSAVDIGQESFTTILNSISNTLFSIDLVHHHSNQSQSFNDLAHGVMKELGSFNLSDYFPLVRFVDPQGSRRRLSSYFARVLDIFDGIIHERLQVRASFSKSKQSNDMLDSLLDLVEENNSEFSLTDLKHLLLDLFFGGIDSTSRTVEWAMTELLRNPKILAKAQDEVRGLLGEDGIEIAEEYEISKFRYLQAIVKETFRLHPPGPFLGPRKADTDVTIHGFRVPKNAQILANVWAMGRDSNVWPNPNSFMPERFLDLEVDVLGQDFELIPFGAGKRICPGLSLAHRMVHLMLASLIYTFDWKLADGLKPEDVDMNEVFGETLHKAVPLLVIPIKV